MSLWKEFEKAISPTEGWANPMSYGFKTIDTLSGGSNGFGSSGKGSGSSLDFIPGIGDARAQDKANEENKKLAQQNRDWMEMMSNTAYQRAMGDMKKAGLNPILSYQQGGASVPNSTAATVSPASATRLVDSATSAFTGISAGRAQLQQANTAQAQAQSTVALQGAQTAQAVAATEKTNAETAKTIDSIKSQKVRRDLERSQVPLAKVKESASTLAQKGTKTIEKFADNFLKNTAKPRVNPKTLRYEGPQNFFEAIIDRRK